MDRGKGDCPFLYSLMEGSMEFGQLKVGDQFDFIDDGNRMMNSFYRRCIKVSVRNYVDDALVEHRIGSVRAKVYHVEHATIVSD